MVFRDNFKRFIEEKTGMKTSNFLKELGMSYSVVKSLDNDVVNHPAHYTGGKMECIDIVDVMTEDKQGLEAFCIGNIVKYLYRYNKKGGVEDVKKAEWYFKKLVEVLEEKQ